MRWERGVRREQVALIQPQSWHWSRIGMGLLCAQDALAKSGILRMVNARRGART